MKEKFFLYARKSTDVEDKQVRSIGDQLAELRAFAEREGLEVIEEFVEKRSAKIPGRPVFNAMLDRIEQGEAGGILAWHADRLARNSVDGGRIIYLLDCGHIQSLKFPTLWFENTSQGKFMLSIVFGQSKYYADSLAENTKRGLRQKVKRGEYPSLAPVGYINDPRTKTVTVDKKLAPVIRRAFELYAQGSSTLEDIAEFLKRNHLVSKYGKRIHLSRVTFILSNPFYVGLFRYAGEVHEGKHEPIVTKKLFDTAQEIMQERSRPRRKQKNEPQPYCGLISCASCGMMITGEYRVKKQKNGNVHEYVYYHCTKKNKAVKCLEPCVRSEVLDEQLSSLIKQVSLPTDWAEELNRMALAEYKNSAQSVSARVKEKEAKIQTISQKLQRLLDGYLEQDIERVTYRQEKAKLLSKKKSLEEEMSSLSHRAEDWLEPLQEWLKAASRLDAIASDADLFVKKVCAKEIFGSNLRLGGNVLAVAAGDDQIHAPKSGQTAWAALRAAHASVGQVEKSTILVQKY